MNKTKTKISIREYFYFSFMFIVILRHFLGTTMIDYSLADNVLKTLSFILKICVSIKIISEIKNVWKAEDLLTAVLTIGLLTVANFYISHPFIWEFILLVLGARNISIKKILKAYLLMIVPLVAITCIASLFGIIDNLIFYRNLTSDQPRYAFGFVYVTNFCAHLFFICAAWAYLRKNEIRYIEIAAMCLIGAGCYYLSEGRNSTICIILLIISLIVSKYIHSKENKFIRSLVRVASIAWMPVLAVSSILLALIYDPNSSFMSRLNLLMGYRPSMDAVAFDRYRVTLLGQEYTTRMFGGKGGVGFPKNYFYIDCSYVSILLSMGLVTLIAIIIMWMIITYRAAKNNDHILAVILSITALHCFMENNIFNVSYNPFFLFLFAGESLVYPDPFGIMMRFKAFYAKKGFKVVVLKNLLMLMFFALIVELLAFNMESITSIFKDYMGTDNYGIEIKGVSIDEDDKLVCDGTFEIFIDDVTKPIESMDIPINMYSIDNSRLMYDEEYSYYIYTYNEETGNYDWVTKVTANTGRPYASYKKFYEKLNANKYLIIVEFGTNCRFDINEIDINGRKPFNINYIRLLVIYIILAATYYFGVEKREAEPSPETIEIQKATNQFESTGALRTEAHKNMKLVYEKKNPIYLFLKRAGDIILSGIAIVLLSPLFLGTAIAIKIEDKGPVFFTQNRAGKDLKPFKMWKFRSMYVNADEKLKEMMAGNEQTGHAFKIKDDPRITKVGKFIRKYSIDELPQLFNVFLGDMSIVGPRPILVFQMEECDDYDKQRLIVQPGLTCIWQVSGRANIKWDQWIELDLDYIDKMSIWTDIKLIVKTVPVVITGDGAF